MSKQDEILERVRKLLRLAESENVNEAATAAAHAARLMERYEIDQAMLAPSTEAQTPIGAEWLWRAKRVPTWIAQLGWGLGPLRHVHVWKMPSVGMQCAGTAANVERTRFLLGWLVGEVERLLVVNKPSGMRRGYSRSWCDSFRRGAVQTILKRLREAKEEERALALGGPRAAYEAAAGDPQKLLALDRAGESFSLVRVETALATLDEQGADAKAWASKAFRLRNAGVRRARLASGFAAGRTAGASASLSGRGLPS